LVNHFLVNDYEVHIISRDTTNLSSLENLINKINIHTHDGTTENLFNIVKDSKPHLVVHLAAAFSNNTHKYHNVDNIIKSNILFGVQLVQSMIMNNVKKLINTGTSWQHYNSDDYNPICLYSSSKQAFSDILKYYVEAFELEVITLKLYHTYGPNDLRNKLFCQLRNAINDSKVLKMTPGEQLIDIVYIDDIVNAYEVAAKRIFANSNSKIEEFFLSSGQHISLKDLVRKYYKIKNAKENILWGGNSYRPREEMVPYSNGNQIPGWKPLIALDEGLKKMEGIV
jgi:nucleoside-diphosphate-sugar epimerase